MPPANDDCASAKVVGVGTQPALDTRAATAVAADPVQTCTLGGAAKNSRSVWFRYTPATSGQLIVNTVGSDYDTVLTLFTGACGAQAPVASGCDDDGAANGTSRVQLQVSAGTSYLIEVTAKGASAAGGSLHLLVAQAGGGTPGVTPTPQSTPGGGGGGDAKTIDRCHKEIEKAGAKLASTTLKAIAACGGRLSKCVQTKAAPDKRNACLGSAAQKCRGDLAKTNTARATFAAAIVKRCGTLSATDVGDASGLGFDALAGTCGGGVDSAAAIATCLASQHQCAAARLLETEQPRARELMDAFGVGAGAFPAVSCLENLGGSGQDLDQEATTGKALDKCARGAASAGAKFVAKRLKSVQSCLDKLFACALLKPGDTACRSKAGDACVKQFGAAAVAESTFRGALEKSCGAVDFDAALKVANGGNVSGLASQTTECTDFNAPLPTSFAAYEGCLTRQHGCRADALVTFEAPRAAELIGAVGAPVTFPDPDCPAVP